MPRWSEDAFPPTLLFLAFAGVAACMPPHNDTWWHLRAGLEMIRTGGILTHETFSHTAYGAPLYHNHEWLSQLLFYGLYQLGGPLLLAAMGTACAMAAVAGAWTLVRGSAEARLGWLALLFFGTVSEWAIRPQVISLALFVVALHLAISTRRRDTWLPVLCLVWANLHAVAIAGVLIAICAAADAVLWSRTQARRSLLIAAACVAAPFFTPLGWHYWPRVFEVVRLTRALQIHEYRSAFELAQLPFWAVVVAFVVVAARPRVLADADRSTRILTLVAALFAVAGATSVRNIPMFILAAAPAMSRLLPAPKTAPKTASRRTKPASATAKFLTAAAVAIVAAVVTHAWRDRGAHLGWVPISPPAIESIRRCDGPLFNGYTDGGILAWFVPDRPVFIDSRGVEAYPVSLLQRSRDADISGDYDRLFADFHIKCAAVSSGSIMARRLAENPAMREQYADREWTVFKSR